MKRFELSGVDLTDFLWRDAQVNSAWTHFIIGIDRRLRAIEPDVFIEHHGPGRLSGCTWRMLVGADGKGCGEKKCLIWPAGAERWELTLSYRGPLITALSWRSQDESEDETTSVQLVELARELAAELRLTYLDQRELRAFEIPWDDIQGDANLRLDWSDQPNAFNLLFYEY